MMWCPESAKTTWEITKYVGQEFVDDAGEFRTGMVEMRLPTLTKLLPPADDMAINFKLWKMAHHTFKKQTKAQHQNSSWVYALVIR